ncbi:hypothetical protein EV426DRAFT_583417 [Tirmania nivea]|nr:hypothetical protein EV426DRAFT_583417 [Tirmania nivea]
MTTYSSLRVNELRDHLSKRKLATNGKKEELIARLEASDREADQATTAAVEPAPAADAKAHLPSAEEYEINWDEDDTAATGTKSTKSASAKPEVTKVAVASTSAGTAVTEQLKAAGTGESKTEEQEAVEQLKDGKKPFTFRRLAEQFTDLPSTKKPDNKKAKNEKPKETPAVTATVESKAEETAAKPEAEAKPATPEPTFTAGLAPTPLEAELEKRKARAARFGAEQGDPNAVESLKKLERAARFGGAVTAGNTESTVGVKGLDQALPERKGKRAGEYGSSGGRGGVQKRTRFGGDRGQRRQGGGGVGGDRRNGGASNQQKKAGGAPAVRGVLDDPAEREKAEKRKNRFGTAA